MDKSIEREIRKCRACQASVEDTSREPLKMSELPEAPWEHLITDYHGPLRNGEYMIVMIDEYSRFPIVEFVSSTTPRKAIPIYDKVFATFGIPKKLKSDNGSPYNSNEFSSYMKHIGVKHKHITPAYPQSNGMVEQFNRMLERLIHTSKIKKKDIKLELNHFLRIYRTTPHLTTGRTPAELLFQSRGFHTRIPEMCVVPKNDEEIRKGDLKKKGIMKKYADNKRNVKNCDINIGDEVLVKMKRQRKSDPYYSPESLVVTARKGNMITAENEKRTITRNSSHFKKLLQQEKVSLKDQ